MKPAKHIPVNFQAQEDELAAQQIEINFKNTPAPGRPSTKLSRLNLQIKMPRAVWLMARRRAIDDQTGRSKAALHHAEPGHSRLF
jgi:hypothetical protein